MDIYLLMSITANKWIIFPKSRGLRLLAIFTSLVAIILILGISLIYRSLLYIVVIQNKTSETIESCVLHGVGPNSNYGDFGPIRSGKRKKISLRIRHEGGLYFTTNGKGFKREGLIDDYVTSDLSGTAIVTIMPEGKFAVELKRY